MEELDADIMIGPLSGDEAVAIANYAKSHPDQDLHHRHRGLAGSDDPDRAAERVPVPRRRRPVERRPRRDRLQEARLAEGRDHHGRLQLRLDVRGRHHRRLLRMGGQITKRVFPPLNTHDYASVHPAAAAAHRSTATSGSIGGSATGTALRRRAGVRPARPEEARRATCSSSSLGNFQQVAPRFVNAYVGGFGTGPGLKTAQAKGLRGEGREGVPGPGNGGTPTGSSTTTTTRPGRWSRAHESNGAVGAALQRAMPRLAALGLRGQRRGSWSSSTPTARRSRTSTRSRSRSTGGKWPRRSSATCRTSTSRSVACSRERARPRPEQPRCKKVKPPWQGKIKVVTNGRVTNAVIK